MTVQLQFRDVTLGYDRHPAVHHLSGEVAAGALVAVVGPNGAGKSTLFRGIKVSLKSFTQCVGMEENMSNQEHDNKGALWAVAIIAFMMVGLPIIIGTSMGWFNLFGILGL